MSQSPFKAIASLVGTGSSSTRFTTDYPQAKQLNAINKYTSTELSNQLHRNFVKQESSGSTRHLTSTSLLNMIYPSHMDSVNRIQTAERLKTLAPEIGTAEEIVVSSIMSPNDLQDGNVTLTINDLPGVERRVLDDIIEDLTLYFDDTYKLPERMKKWVSESKFRSGSYVTMLLPESTLANIVAPIQREQKLKGNEKYNILPDVTKNIDDLGEIYNLDTYEQLLDITSYKPNKTASFESLMSKNKNMKDLDITKAAVDKYYPGITQDILNRLESKEMFSVSLESISKIKDNKLKDSFEKKVSILKSSLEAITATITTKLEDGDLIKISDTPEVLRFGKAFRSYIKSRMNKNILDMYNEYPYGHTKQQDGIQKTETVMNLVDYMGDENDYGTMRPFSIEIPTEAVIPVCNPGSIEEKIGYFVLVDSEGRPINSTMYINSYSFGNNDGRVANSFNAVYGVNNAGISSPNPVTNGFNNVNTILNNTVTNTNDKILNEVFGYILDQTLKKKLESQGHSEVHFEEYENIARCMFYRSLKNLKTSLIFVPEKFITYVAFDYRSNGCGKSLLEDIDFILSLRATLFTANMMAMMKNSIPRKEVTINMDEKDVDTEQLTEQVRNAFIQKNKPSFSNVPGAIAEDMLNMNLSIKTNHPSAAGFSIEHTDTQTNIPKADTELNEVIDKLLVTALGVPYGALNAVGEAEYAISVATVNLFFSNRIAEDQKILCGFATEHIRNYLLFSKELRELIGKHLANKNFKEVMDKDTESPEGSVDVDKKDTNIDGEIIRIISNIEVMLPKPNIAPQKAQMESLRSYLETIDSLIDNLYNDGLIHGDTDSELTSMLNTVKAYVKRNLTKDFIESLGMSNTFRIEDLSEFYTTNRENLMSTRRTLENLNKDIELDKAARTTETEDGEGMDEDSGGSDDYDFG